MFDYYRFRFSMFKGWNPEFGYELMAPAGLFGAALVLFVLYLTVPDFGFLMWKAAMPLPGKVAIGVVIVLLVAAYIADDLKRPGLWLIVGFCTAGLAATIAGTIGFVQRHGSRLYYAGIEEPVSVYLISAAYTAYLLVMLALTAARFREANGES